MTGTETTAETTTETTAERAYETLLVDTSTPVAVVTVNRPSVRNALDARVQAELGGVLAALADDDAVGAVVLTGAGDRAFVAGADITQVEHYSPATGLAARMQRLFDAVEDFPKPTIAAVAGFALGGGCELALACDLRIAAETARFGLPETALGVLPGAGGTQRLTRIVGSGRALEMILTGRFVGAREALTAGLVTAVVPPEDLLPHAREVAEAIVARGPLATRLAKLVVRTGTDTDRRTGLVVERLAQSVLYGTADKREGARAFLDKRPPAFRGE